MAAKPLRGRLPSSATRARIIESIVVPRRSLRSRRRRPCFPLGDLTENHLRRIFFRTAAVMLGFTFAWAFCAGAFDNMSPFKRVMSLGLAVVFVLYGLFGDRPADHVLGQLLGFSSQEPNAESDSAIDSQQRSSDDDS